MPGPGTHTTIVQRLAKSAHDRGDPATRFLADFNLNADWSTYATPDALQARFAMLGSMGPDIFFAMLDYGAGIQQLEDFVVKVLGTFRCVGQLSSRINNLVDSTLDDFSDEVWSEIQRTSTLVKNITVGGLLDLLIERNDGRLHDFLRAAARTANPELILGSAVNVWLGGATHALFGDPSTITSGRPDQLLAVALAQLAVTGRSTFNAFVALSPQDADLVAMYDAIFPGSPFARQDIEDAARQVLDAAYRAIWAIRANDPSWRAERAALGWIAVSGFDDTPHRPVNIPSSPYPQHDLTLTVPRCRRTGDRRHPVHDCVSWRLDRPVAAGHHVVHQPDPRILGAPNGTRPSGRIPRAIPPDTPTVSATGKIIVYVHGGESRAEEAIDMAN